MKAKQFVDKFEMQKHPEGGYFKETYRAEEWVQQAHLPERFTGDRSFCTAIYFLLEGTQFSAFHRIKSDELWHFYYGTALHIYVIAPDGKFELIKLGSDVIQGEVFQAVVKAGCWFASASALQMPETDSFSFVGCTVSPGFNFADFELAEPDRLAELFPEQSALIKRFCRGLE